jgi:type IV pilus assembly protein PilQ
MRKYMLTRLFLPIILVTLVAGCATTSRVREAAADDGAVITGIKVEDNSLAISSNKHFTYTIYSTADPYRITVEIPDMSAGNFDKKIVSEKAGFTEIVPRQTARPNPTVKIDIALQSPAPVEPLYKDNTLTIRVKGEEPVNAGGAAPPKTENVKAADEPTAKDVSATGDEPAESSVVEEKASDTDKSAGKAAEASGKETPDGNEKATDKATEKAVEKIAAKTAAEDVKVEERRPASKATEITGVNLEKAGGVLKVVIKGNGVIVPNVFPLDKRIVVDIPDVTMNTSLPESVISPLSGIRAGEYRHKVRVVLDLKEKTAFEVVAVGDSIEISLERKGTVAAAVPSAGTTGKAVSSTAPAKPTELATPPSEEAKEGKTEAAQQVAASGGTMPATGMDIQEEGKYRGKKISLDFQNAEIVPIFRLLADVNGYNLVVDPSVQGKVTIKLMNVPWDQALEIILNNTTPPLSYTLRGNILWIAPVSKFDTLVKEKEKLRKSEESAEPLTQEIIRVNYATASEIRSAISSAKLLSPRGDITIDSRMNTLIVKDTQKSIDNIKDLVKIMDVAKPQVMIEAKIVQVTNNYNETLGIRWGGSFTTQTFPNVVDGTFSVNSPVTTPGLSDNNPGGALGMTVGHANTAQVSLSLSALESIGKAKTLSNPKILTMDNEAATIQQGKTFFISTVSQSGTQTQQQQATLMLQVTPKIAPDGYVQLKVDATDNSLEPGTAGSNAVVDTKMIKTQALVGDGETLVLGGIYTTTETNSEDGVPFLGRIPVLGWLFKTRNRVGPSVSELLIFITPKIVGRTM